jgi:hypothetical protein
VFRGRYFHFVSEKGLNPLFSCADPEKSFAQTTAILIATLAVEKNRGSQELMRCCSKNRYSVIWILFPFICYDPARSAANQIFGLAYI